MYLCGAKKYHNGQSYEFTKKLQNIFEIFMRGEFSKAFEAVELLLPTCVSVGEFREVELCMRILFVGSLWGLENINQILESRGISSDNLYKHWGNFSRKQIEDIVNELFMNHIGELLLAKGGKSESTWSRSEISFVGDVSIFMQWLSTAEGIAGHEYFAKYFSGQRHTTVYGWRVFLLGMVVDGTFYPMYFQIMSKKDCEKAVAGDLLEKAGDFLKDFQAKHADISFPNLFCGFDSGFHDKLLLGKAELAGFTPICVAKNNHIIHQKGGKYAINKYISEVFEPAEATAAKNGKDFVLRVRVYYQSLEREVVMIFFRLNGSKKVSAVYTTDISLSAKTIRRRWFQRTQIEQFFRMMKDTLKIQHSKSTDIESFAKKLCVFLFKATFAYRFRNEARKQKGLKNIAFSKLMFFFVNYDINSNYLDDLLQEIYPKYKYK